MNFYHFYFFSARRVIKHSINICLSYISFLILWDKMLEWSESKIVFTFSWKKCTSNGSKSKDKAFTFCLLSIKLSSQWLYGSNGEFSWNLYEVAWIRIYNAIFLIYLLICLLMYIHHLNWILVCYQPIHLVLTMYWISQS